MSSMSNPARAVTWLTDDWQTIWDTIEHSGYCYPVARRDLRAAFVVGLCERKRTGYANQVAYRRLPEEAPHAQAPVA